jgi:hypothetical protein
MGKCYEQLKLSERVCLQAQLELGFKAAAIGGTAADGILLVGTRVQGDTMPRPVLVVNVVEGGDLAILTEQGYAIVGYLINLDSSGNLLSYYWIGER